MLSQYPFSSRYLRRYLRKVASASFVPIRMKPLYIPLFVDMPGSIAFTSSFSGLGRVRSSMKRLMSAAEGGGEER